MRTSSGADLSENLLENKKLALKEGLQSSESCVECAGLTGWWFDPVGGFGRAD
jgi:hypothetical protein